MDIARPCVMIVDDDVESLDVMKSFHAQIKELTMDTLYIIVDVFIVVLKSKCSYQL